MTGVSVVGLGKLGACMAACIASKGYAVTGIDSDPKVVDQVNHQRAPVVEPGLNEMIQSHSERITAQLGYEELALHSDITFIVVPTPSDDDGAFSLQYVMKAASQIGQALRQKKDYHLVVLSSTVLPGATEFALKPILENMSGKTCGKDFGLCYNPEFIALGSVIRDFLNPDFVLIGESDKRAGLMLEDFYKSVCENEPPIVHMNFANAELTKIAINTFVTTKITFANMVAHLCERLPGGNVDVVTDALGLDRRIGKRYLKGGLGYGGPCFPRDNVALSRLGHWLDSPVLLSESTDRLNRELADRLVWRVRQYLNQIDTRVGVLGLAYKPDSNVVEESQAVYLVEELVKDDVPVTVYDPIAMPNARSSLGKTVAYAESVQEVLSKCDVIVIANPDPAFAGIESSDIPARNRPVVVIDCWRILENSLSSEKHIEYCGLGLAGREADTSEQLKAIWAERVRDIMEDDRLVGHGLQNSPSR